MNRITNKDLEILVERLNNVTNSPHTSWTRRADGTHTANIGNYHISGAYGGVCLHRIQSDGGGVEDVFRCGHIPKRELHERIWSYLTGIEQEKRAHDTDDSELTEMINSILEWWDEHKDDQIENDYWSGIADAPKVYDAPPRFVELAQKWND